MSNHTTTRTPGVARTVVASLASALAAAAALIGLGPTPARAAGAQPGTEPITGTVRFGGAVPRAFTGWLELSVLIDTIVDESHDRPDTARGTMSLATATATTTS